MGKCAKAVKTINVEGIDVEYLSSKKDKFDNLIRYSYWGLIIAL